MSWSAYSSGCKILHIGFPSIYNSFNYHIRSAAVCLCLSPPIFSLNGGIMQDKAETDPLSIETPQKTNSGVEYSDQFDRMKASDSKASLTGKDTSPQCSAVLPSTQQLTRLPNRCWQLELISLYGLTFWQDQTHTAFKNQSSEPCIKYFVIVSGCMMITAN